MNGPPSIRSAVGSTTDACFDPEVHLAIDPRPLSWADVADRARERDVVADLTVNHMPDRSAPYRDVVERGGRWPFFTYDRVCPTGGRGRCRPAAD